MVNKKTVGIILLLVAITAVSAFAYSLSGTYKNDLGSKLILSGTSCTLDLGYGNSASGSFSIQGNNLIMTFSSGFMKGSMAVWTIINNDTIKSDGNSTFSK